MRGGKLANTFGFAKIPAAWLLMFSFNIFTGSYRKKFFNASRFASRLCLFKHASTLIARSQKPIVRSRLPTVSIY